jgi:Predicted molecular chaperone distantly related to HSP70-fold metalloproteases
MSIGPPTEQQMSTAIGLMSGTSLDGIDAAILTTDGERIADRGAATTIPYPPAFRARLRRLLGRAPDDGDTPVIEELTDRHAEAVTTLLQTAGLSATAIDVVGCHGQTVLHLPREQRTIQLGDAQRLADRLGLPVVADFRAADVAAGGEGAPLAPLYHLALARDLERPLAVLNVGGVANVTWIGPGADPNVLAFDTGPGNALLDDWLLRTTGQPFDAGGALAARGRIDAVRLASWLLHPYFRHSPPKSLDRDDFATVVQSLDGADPAGGAATLSAFTAHSVARAMAFFPAPAQRWLVCGGGRHNPTLMRMIADAVTAPVVAVESVGWRGDYLEAEAFAFLAVRSLRGLPLSLPTTTGVAKPQTGGRWFHPKADTWRKATAG